MNEQTVDQSLNHSSNLRQSWKFRLGLLGAALMVSLAAGYSAMNHLVPRMPDRAQGVPARLGWYFHHGQLQADVHTLAAAVQFIMESDGQTPAVTNIANLPVAGDAVPGSPRS